MSITVKQLKAVVTLDQLEALNIGQCQYDISGRGGYLGFYGQDVSRFLEIDDSFLPPKFGVYCNYLGGGLRGSLCTASFSKNVPAKKARLLSALVDACKRVYENVENDEGLNAETYLDGNTNWNAVGTKASRIAEIKSAY
jgi:hypothetical protein